MASGLPWPPRSPGAGRPAWCSWHATERASRSLGVRLQSLEVRRPEDLAGAFQAAERERAEAMIVVGSRLMNLNRRSIGDFAGALEGLDAPPVDDEPTSAWSVERLKTALDDYRAEHGQPRFDPEARNLRHTHVTASDDRRAWKVQQVIVDAEQENDWMAEFAVDLAASRDANRPLLRLQALGPIG